MATTMDFDDWLECTDLSDYNDVYSLYRSVADLMTYGGYNTVQAPNGAYILTADDVEDSLCLATDKARDAFLKTIEYRYCDDMDIEGYYAFHREMEKDN